MKSFEEFSEALSMDDLKKIPGGTDAQRKIAQDRQKAREAKNRGFGSNAPTKKEPPKKKEAPGGALAKSEPSAIKKPDLRKSQIGKWSQGIKNSPDKLAKKAGGALAKKAGSALAKKAGAIVKRDDIEHVDVKDEGPTTKDEKQAGKRPGSSRDKIARSKFINNMKKKARKTAVAGAKGAAKGAASLAKTIAKKGYEGMQQVSGREGSVTSSGDLQGLSGRNKGLIG